MAELRLHVVRTDSLYLFLRQGPIKSPNWQMQAFPAVHLSARPPHRPLKSIKVVVPACTYEREDACSQ